MTSFEDWVATVELDNNEEIYSIYKTVEELVDHGIFSITQDGEKYVVSTKGFPELELKSEDARAAFLIHIQTIFFPGMDVEPWYSIQKNN